MKKTTVPSAVTLCKCGYTFEMSKPARVRTFESYAVIRDKQYQRFLKAEARVSAAADNEEKLRAIAKSSKLVGSIYVCPDCGRLLFSMPDVNPTAIYVRDDE